MKKILVAIALMCVMTIVCSCGQVKVEKEVSMPIDSEYVVNAEYNSKSMKTIAGNEFVARGDKKTAAYKMIGLGITDTDEIISEREKGKISGFVGDDTCLITYSPQKAIEMMPTEEDYSKMSDEEISECWKKVRKKELDLCAVLIEDVKNSEANERLESTKKDFEHIEKLLEFDDKIFYFVYNDDTSNLELTEDEKQVLDKIIKSYGYIKDNLCIFKAVDEEEGFMHEEGKSVMEGSLSEFTAQTTDEKDVNQEIFKKYDITMVNVWTTWCGYCVEEMKDIQTLYKKIPDNVNIISVCVDGDSEKEIVEEIIKDKGMEFLTIRGNDELKDTFYKYVEAYPTTVFVDQNGNIVGKEQVGVPENGYGELINDALETIGKERSVK